MERHNIRQTTLHGLSRPKVAARLHTLLKEMRKAEKNFSTTLAGLHDHYKLSGANLIHYLVLRSSEIREIQEFLHHIGLSSLTNSESHTLAQVQLVHDWLKAKEPQPRKFNSCTYQEASRLQLLHTEELLGVMPGQDRPHIMVTFDATLMQDRKLVEDMLNAGMTVARINCAHDSREIWLKMIQVLQKAMIKTGKRCKIYMDLAGPKIRIKSISSGKTQSTDKLEVREGQELILTHTDFYKGKKLKKKNVLCIEPKELLDMVRVGEHIFFDDGKFEAKVTKAGTGEVWVDIVRISAKSHFLKPERGINLPDSELTIPTLTDEDKSNIPFVCQHADMVGYSFVSSTEDIELLRGELNKYKIKKKPSIILKIERLSAIQNLPALLINGMKDEAFGVMIARGDLAVEIGFERLSEIQEEILWICEAAHVPVIWATQVLETLNKTGYATRSEITDAAMSGRAECVMLNKGQHIVKTIRTLDDILMRQQGHVNKKRYIMRPLSIAKTFIQT